MRDHIRVTTQPFDSPPDADGVADIIDQIGSDRMFLFASDYPHWQFDGDDAIPPHLPDSIVSRMCADNPLETFPRLKLAADSRDQSLRTTRTHLHSARRDLRPLCGRSDPPRDRLTLGGRAPCAGHRRVASKGLHPDHRSARRACRRVSFAAHSGSRTSGMRCSRPTRARSSSP